MCNKPGIVKLMEKLLLIVKTLKLSSKLKIFIYNHTLKDPLYCTIYKHHFLQDKVVVGLVDVICEQRLSTNKTTSSSMLTTSERLSNKKIHLETFLSPVHLTELPVKKKDTLPATPTAACMETHISITTETITGTGRSTPRPGLHLSMDSSHFQLLK